MKTYSSFILLLILFSLSQNIFAQKKQGQARIDSLLIELPKAQEDTNKVNLLRDISMAYYKINPNEGIKYGTQSLELAEKSNWKNGVANANRTLGSHYITESDYPKALEYFDKAVKIFETLGNRKQIAGVFHNIGIVYKNQSNYRKALEYLQQALSINEEYGNKNWKASNLNSIAGIYIEQGDYFKGIEYYTKSLKINEEIGDKASISNNINNIGTTYFYQANYPKALEYFFRSLKMNEESGAKQQIASSLNNIGNVYSEQSEYTKALEYYTKAIKINEEIGNKNWKAINLNAIGTIYSKQANYAQALDYLLKSYKINEELGRKGGMSTTLNNIGNVYLQQADYPKALEYLFKALKISKETGDKNEIGVNWGGIGNTYLSIAKDNKAIVLNEFFLGNKHTCLEQAKFYIDSAIVIQKETGDLLNLYKNYKKLSEIQTLLGNAESGLENYKYYTFFKDSIFNIEKDKKLTQTALQYEFTKKEDSLKLVSEKRELGLQKEMELKALSYQYEKKRAAAKTEEEKQKLLFEEKLKQQEIESNYTQKMAAAEAIEKQKELEREKKELARNQKEELAKAEQEKKDIRQRNIRNFILVGLFCALAFLLVVYRQRNRIAKEKQRSEELLLNILPAETAEELKATGVAQAKDFAEVTVLFTDFKNFTNMSERLSAQELVSEINYYYSAFDNIISKYNIEKIKTIGDAYMCAGGLPTANKTHAEDTVNAALEIRDFILAEKEKRQTQGKNFIEIRIGCNTGPVIAGIVGIKKFAYDIWGDTVNTASRMESSGEVGKVNISGSTYKLVKGKFTCTYRGKIEAKNKGEVDMYFVEA